YLKQHATIAGFHNAQFKRSLTSIQDIAYMLVTSLGEGQMEPWFPEVESDEHGATLVANCRYFTIGRYIPPEIRLDFPKYVDPAGTLKKFVDGRVAHCLDNNVAYLEVKGNE
ncbi:hypothetical protein B0H13DRAFT_1626881, partial [Mycena leptocephala]